MTTIPTLPRLLTPEEAAAIIGVKVTTLGVWRATQRYDLKYVKAGHLVKYRESDIADFLESRTRTPKPTVERG